MRAVLAAAVLVALTACSSGTPSAAPSSSPTPAPVKTVVKTETETVEVTPQACLDAITEARAGFGLAADALSASGEMLGLVHPAAMAGLERDVAAMQSINDQAEQYTANLQRLNTQVQANRFGELAAECESSAP